MADELTFDPHVVIENRLGDRVTYRNLVDGRRWEVIGVCDRRGDCLIGAVLHGVQIRDKAHLAELVATTGLDRIDSELDVPVAPGFTGCCPLEARWLS